MWQPYYPPILAYHRVGPSRDDHVPTVSAEVFEAHLRWLTRLRCDVLSLDALVERLDRGEGWPKRSVVITFDDGYEETATIAWPLLKRFRFPATVFVAPAEVERPGFVTWEQASALAHDGLSLGSHTTHHTYLPALDPSRLPEELIESKRIIEARIGCPVRFLSYPLGGFTPQVQAVARQAGYRAACTTNRTSGQQGLDRYALRRIKMTERDAHWLLFRAKISGYYDGFRQLRTPH